MAKTREQITNGIVKETAQSIPQITNYNTGGVFRSFVEVVAAFLEKLYQAVDALLPNRYTQTASGQYLDWKAEELGLARRPAVKARGYVVLSRTKPTGNVRIPAGKVLASRPDSKGKVFRYVIAEAAVLEEGALSIAVLVEAEAEGSASNLGAGLITEFATPLGGIDSASNTDSWLAQPGADTEGDAGLRLRCLAIWRGLSGANKDAYIAWAKSIEGIDNVKVLPLARGAGTVDVICTAAGNALPNEELLEKVRSAIEEHRPIGADVLVRAPFELVLNTALEARYLPNREASKLPIEEAVREYFAGLAIGEDFEPSALSARISAIEGVKGVSITAPPQTRLSPLQIARLGALTVLVSNDSEE